MGKDMGNRIFEIPNKIFLGLYSRLLHRLYPEEVPRVKRAKIDGFDMYVLVNEAVGKQIKYLGGYERADSRYLRSVAGGFDVSFDVGANIGYYTILLASASQKSVVHAFEPLKVHYHILGLNVELGRFEDVFLNNCAVGCEEEVAHFSVSRDGSYSSFKDTKRKSEMYTIRVPTVTIDRYMADKGIEKVDFIKIDVEGAEKLVLDGARELLGDRSRRPHMMMIELYDDNLKFYDTSITEMIQMLGALGYEPFVVTGNSLTPFEESHYNLIYNVFFISP